MRDTLSFIWRNVYRQIIIVVAKAYFVSVHDFQTNTYYVFYTMKAHALVSAQQA